MSVEADLAPMGLNLARWLDGQSFGAVRVVRVDSAVITDVDGYLAIDLTVVLTDPAAETWPPEEIQDLRRSVRWEARKYPEAPFVYLSLRPETDDEPAEDVESGR